MDIGRLGRLAVAGYGLLGRAAALNLRDQGFPFELVLRGGGESFARAAADGFTPRPLEEGLAGIDTLYALLPDPQLATVLSPAFSAVKTPRYLVLASGAAVHYRLLPAAWPAELLLVAPKCPLRQNFVDGVAVPLAIGAARAAALPAARALASAVGGKNARFFPTDFRSETLSDLLGEQFVLCGGLPALMEAAFQVLVASGIDPELAALDVAHELKIVLPFLLEEGSPGMRRRISPVARQGASRAQTNLLELGLRRLLEQELERMQRGDYLSQLIAETPAPPNPAGEGLARALRSLQEKFDVRP